MREQMWDDVSIKGSVTALIWHSLSFVNESLCTLRGEVGHSWQRKQVRQDKALSHPSLKVNMIWTTLMSNLPLGLILDQFGMEVASEIKSFSCGLANDEVAVCLCWGQIKLSSVQKWDSSFWRHRNQSFLNTLVHRNCCFGSMRKGQELLLRVESMIR